MNIYVYLFINLLTTNILLLNQLSDLTAMCIAICLLNILPFLFMNNHNSVGGGMYPTKNNITNPSL